MIDPFSLIPAPQDLPLEVFSETSRYRGVALLAYVDAQGRDVVYVGRRWVPAPELFPDVGRYQVRDGDRIDNVAAELLGDPQLYWRIADANAALAPGELLERIGRWLRITMPAAGPRQG